jgi:glycosyltransferase involved in cell wall biosynthesis
MTPKVSICIPAYNRREMFRATLWSVIQQTNEDLEIIISDNASEEDLRSVADGFDDPRIIFHRQPRNIGPAENGAFLEDLARGEFVIFLMSDDLLLPHCVSKAVAALQTKPGCGGIVYKAAHYSAEGFRFFSTMPSLDYAGAEEYARDRAVRDFRFASPSLCLYRRLAIQQIGGSNRELLAARDWEIYSRMIRQGGGMMFLHEVLAIMRLHDNRQSNTSALHWGFYHDVMLLAGKPEHQWGGAYRTKCLAEQLLWDWRLRRSPRRTLNHAWKTGAFPIVIFFMPWELLRRLGLKLQRVLGVENKADSKELESLGLRESIDLDELEQFWNASETIRVGGDPRRYVHAVYRD